MITLSNLLELGVLQKHHNPDKYSVSKLGLSATSSIMISYNTNPPNLKRKAMRFVVDPYAAS